METRCTPKCRGRAEAHLTWGVHHQHGGMSWNINASAGDMSESNVASGTSDYSDTMTLAGGVWTDDPSLSASTTSQSGYTSANTSSNSYDEPGSRDNGGYSSGNVTSNAIVTTTSNYNYGSNQWDSTTALSGSGQANWTSGAYYNYVHIPSEDTWSQQETNSSWSPLGSGTAVSETVSSTYAGNPAPDPAYSSSSAQYSLADFSQTGGLWVSGYPFELPTLGTSSGLTTGGTGFPGSGQTLGSIPAVPAIVSNFGTPTLPGGAGVSSLLPGSPGSLAGIAPLPGAVGGLWGMGFTQQTVPQTLFAAGNTAGAAGFTSETMVGAGGVFGGNNVAVVVPVTRAGVVVNYGFTGVSAGNPAEGGGVSGDDEGDGETADMVGLAAGTPAATPDATPAAQPGGSGASNGPTGNKIVPTASVRTPADSRGTWIRGTKGNGTFKFFDTPENRAAGLAEREFQFEGGFLKPGGFPSNFYYGGSAQAASVPIGTVTGTDAEAADIAMRLKLRNPNWQRPPGYVWNHAGPPGSKVMELVDEQAHRGLAHKGSAAAVRAAERAAQAVKEANKPIIEDTINALKKEKEQIDEAAKGASNKLRGKLLAKADEVESAIKELESISKADGPEQVKQLQSILGKLGAGEATGVQKVLAKALKNTLKVAGRVMFVGGILITVWTWNERRAEAGVGVATLEAIPVLGDIVKIGEDVPRDSQRVARDQEY